MSARTNSRFAEQLALALRWLLPSQVALALNTRAGQFFGLLLCFTLAMALLLSLIYHQYGSGAGIPEARRHPHDAVGGVPEPAGAFGVAAWIIVLAHESRRAAEKESARQTPC